MEPKYTRTSPLLQRLHWLPVAKRIQFRTLVHTYNIMVSAAPGYLASTLHVKQSTYSLRSTSGTSFTIPRSHRLAGDKAFSIIAPVLWNALPFTIRNSSSLADVSKRLLKLTFLSLMFPSSFLSRSQRIVYVCSKCSYISTAIIIIIIK